MKPRMAFIGVRSSWLTLARNRDFASLAAGERGVRLARAAWRACADPRTSVASRSLVPLRSRASFPNSSRFGTSTCCVKSPAVIAAERRSILRTGRMNAHDSTNPSSRATMTLVAEKAMTIVVSSRARRTEAAARAPSSGALASRSGCASTASSTCDVGMLLVQGAGPRAPMDVSRAVERQGLWRWTARSSSLSACGWSKNAASAGSARSIASRSVDERRLRVSTDLVFDGVVPGEQGHRPVVALRRDRVEHVLGAARLDVELVEVGHPVVHPPDHDQAEDAHRDQQQCADEKPEQQLPVHAGLGAGDRIDDGAQPSGEARQARFGRLHRGAARLDRPRPGREWDHSAHLRRCARLSVYTGRAARRRGAGSSPPRMGGLPMTARTRVAGAPGPARGEAVRVRLQWPPTSRTHTAFAHHLGPPSWAAHRHFGLVLP